MLNVNGKVSERSVAAGLKFCNTNIQLWYTFIQPCTHTNAYVGMGVRIDGTSTAKAVNDGIVEGTRNEATHPLLYITSMLWAYKNC